jgi:hypothetical protein
MDTNPEQPAFPRDHRYDGHNGMTLRDYFAAHAPSKAPSWFVPKGTVRPHWSEPGPALPHGRSERQPNGTSAMRNCCTACDEYFKASAAFEAEKNRREAVYQIALYTQWPWAYADAMLGERAKGVSLPSNDGATS